MSLRESSLGGEGGLQTLGGPRAGCPGWGRGRGDSPLGGATAAGAGSEGPAQGWGGRGRWGDPIPHPL